MPQGFSHSKGGITTKIHLRVNSAGLPTRNGITPSHMSDHLGFGLVMADNTPETTVLLADRGYDDDSTQEKMTIQDVLT